MLHQPARLLRVAIAATTAFTAIQYLLVRVLGTPDAKNLTLLEYLLRPIANPAWLIILEQCCLWATVFLLWRATGTPFTAVPQRQTNYLLALQTVLLALGANETLPLVAAEAGLLLPGRIGQLWLGGLIALQTILCLFFPLDFTWMSAPGVLRLNPSLLFVIEVISLPATDVLAYSLGLLSAVEARQRSELVEVHQQVVEANQELKRANATLSATQQMEAEAARIAERVTIARELHDALGHHLAGLSVNLQLATKCKGSESNPALADAYLLARMLLGDVRNVVTDLRELDGASLRAALETMASSISAPQISLEFDDDLEVVGPLTGHTLFRCAQEAITNAVRHSEAKNLWISLTSYPAGIRLHARDDGRGSADLYFGHGLTGMRERVETLGGWLHCTTRPGEGFAIEISLPAKGAAA